MRTHKAVAAAVVLAAPLATAASIGTTADAAQGPSRPRIPAVSPEKRAVHAVTLITGDTVIVRTGASGRPVVTVQRGKGRSGIRFITRHGSDGHVRVIPSDALPLLRNGRLDDRLFDVTRLVAWHYDDGGRRDIPLIAERRASGMSVTVRGARATRSLPAAGMDGLSVAKARAAVVWRGLTGGGLRTQGLGGGVSRLWLDGRVHASSVVTGPVAPQPAGGLSRTRGTGSAGTGSAGTGSAGAGSAGTGAAGVDGLNGKGVTVAVLDTGVDAAHPDLKGRVAVARDFSRSGSTADKLGHGTHVASIVAGSGAASAGRYRGVATGAKLAVGKVLDDSGEGQDSWVIAGMQWAATKVKARIVNMSLGAEDSPGLDPVEKALDTLSKRRHTLFVVAAGNDGPLQRTIGSPGSVDAALTVGAVDHAGEVAFFSSQGPRLGDDAVKPDVTAPGVDIVAARPPGNKLGEPVGPYYQKLSGTSMATPHVAGTAAVLAQQHPGWTGARLKAALMSAARPNPKFGQFAQGAGQVDLARATTQPVIATVGAVNAFLRYPHVGGQHLTRTVTYHNSASTPVTLALSTSMRDRDGKLLGRSPVGLSADALTVPAHGSAHVTVNVAADGVNPQSYGGLLTARSADGAIVATTVLGAYVEPPATDLTITVRGWSGRPVPGTIELDDLNGGDSSSLDAPHGTITTHLLAGRYSVLTYIDGRRRPTLIHLPVTVLPGRRTLTLDARKTVPVRHTVDEPSANPVALAVSSTIVSGRNSVGVDLTNTDPVHSTSYVLPVHSPDMDFVAYSEFLKKGYGEGTRIGPYRISLADHRTGGVPRRLAYRARKADLARITETYRGPGKAATAFLEADVETSGGGGGFGLPARLPMTYTHYLTADPGIGWSRGLIGYEGPGVGIQDVARPYSPGPQPAETWNSAVIGPSGAPSVGARYGDFVQFFGYGGGGLFSDAVAGHVGRDYGATGTVTLSSGGRRIAKSELYDFAIELPKKKAAYRLDVTAVRSRRIVPISTRIDASWTFTSGHSAGVRGTPLPLLAVRFAPQGLDLRNRAKAGTPVAMNVWAEADPGSGAGAVKSVTVEASFDRGRSWQPLTMTAAGSGWTTTVTSPVTATSVALRASAADDKGNTVRESILDAYLLRR